MKKLSLFVVLLLMLLAIFNSCTKAEKLDFHEQYSIGVGFLNEGEYEKAILSFEMAIEIDPRMVQPYIDIANIYIEQNQYDMAESIIVSGLNVLEENSVLTDKLAEIHEGVVSSGNETSNSKDDAVVADSNVSPEEVANFRAIYEEFVNVYQSDYNITSYQFADLDGNGVEEMLLQLEYWHTEMPPPMQKSALYSIQNNEVFLIKETDSPASNSALLKISIDNSTQRLVLVGDYMLNSWGDYGSSIALFDYDGTTVAERLLYGYVHSMEMIHGEGYYESDINEYLYYTSFNEVITKEEYEEGMSNINLSDYNSLIFYLS